MSLIQKLLVLILKLNKMKKTWLCLLFGFISLYSLFAQVQSKFLPSRQISERVKYHIKDEAPKIKMKNINIQKLLEEDKKEEKLNVPMRFGTALDVNLDISSNGKWFEIDSGRIWKLEISSDGAYSINMIFDKFYLPEGAELFIYSADNSMAFGPITFLQNNNRKRFSTDLIKGSSVIIELFVPSKEYGKTELRIAKVIHGYKNMFNGYVITDPAHDSENCNNDVDCPEFSAWSDQNEAIALIILADGTRWCSGCLMNNTNNDFRPYFLTAFHCIDVGDPHVANQQVWNGSTWVWTDPDEADRVLQGYEIDEAEDWVFRFKYESPSPVCNGGETMLDGIAFITYSGSTFRAGRNNTDFTLVEMNTTPARGNRIFYAGWSRSTTAPTSSVGIHHPRGDVMKISIENGAATATDWNNSGVNNHWLVNFDDGVVQHGSSGSPLFDQNRRVVGQLHGNDEYNRNLTYCAQPRAQYGRFDISWTGGGANNNRLSNWLDPLGIIGANGTFNGAYRPCPGNSLSNRTWSSNISYSNCQITVTNSTITNNSTVTFDAESEVIINGNFEVQSGSSLIVR